MIRLLPIAVLLAGLPASAQESPGRFVTSPNGDGPGVWIVDTQTGEAKFCLLKSDSSARAGYVAICTEPTQ